MDSKNVVLNKVNDEIIQNEPGKLQKKNLGKGKILLKIQTILRGAAAVFEGLRELPGFEYLKAMTTGNLVTRFNTWIASIMTKAPDLTNLTAEEAFKLGQQAQAAGTIESANSLGLVFSAILEFIVQHPTVTVIGVVGFFGLLSIPFKALFHKLTKHEEQKLASRR